MRPNRRFPGIGRWSAILAKAADEDHWDYIYSNMDYLYNLDTGWYEPRDLGVTVDSLGVIAIGGVFDEEFYSPYEWYEDDSDNIIYSPPDDSWYEEDQECILYYRKNEFPFEHKYRDYVSGPNGQWYERDEEGATVVDEEIWSKAYDYFAMGYSYRDFEPGGCLYIG